MLLQLPGWRQVVAPEDLETSQTGQPELFVQWTGCLATSCHACRQILAAAIVSGTVGVSQLRPSVRQISVAQLALYGGNMEKNRVIYDEHLGYGDISKHRLYNAWTFVVTYLYCSTEKRFMCHEHADRRVIYLLPWDKQGPMARGMLQLHLLRAR